MSVFGMSPGRVALYGSALAVLAALNFWQFSSGTSSGGSGSGTLEQTELLLPEITEFAPSDIRVDTVQRDLFRPEEAPPPAPEEPVVTETEDPQPKPPPPDPKELAIKEAMRQINEMSVLGIMSTATGMVAVVGHRGGVRNVEVGEELIPGFVARRITLEGIMISNYDLGIEHELRVDPEIGN